MTMSDATVMGGVTPPEGSHCLAFAPRVPQRVTLQNISSPHATTQDHASLIIPVILAVISRFFFAPILFIPI